MFHAFTRPRYQVSVYRTIGPLVLFFNENHVGKYCVTSGAILFAYVP